MHRKTYSFVLGLSLFVSTLCLADTQFTGAISNDWFNPGNWNNGLPAPGNNALIGGASTVIVGSPLTVNFTIENYGSLTFAANVVNNGTVFSLGTLIFTSSSDVTNFGSFSTLGPATFQPNANFTNEIGGALVNGGTFTLPTTLLNKGDIVNNGNMNATDGTLQTQGTFENNQTLTTKFLTVAAGTSFANNFGANLNITGSGATFTANGLVNNFGTITNGGVTIVNNTFNNNGLLKNLVNATLTVNPGKTLDNDNGIVDNEGKFENKGTFINGNEFSNEGEAKNTGQFQNNNLLENLADGLFENASGGSITMGFGTELLNAGDFENDHQITSTGLIQNDGEFQNDGTLTNNNGSVLDNNNKLTNNGTINAVNVVINDGIFQNNASFNVNSGSVFSNFSNFTNQGGGVLTNAFDIINKSGATFTNAATVNNNVRFTNEGSVVNNSTFNNAGDFFNKPGATVSNTSNFKLLAGNLRNQGSLTNTSQLSVDNCSSIRNLSSIANNGTLTLKGILFQTGTLTGNAPSVQGGYIHVSTSSSAPTVCKNGSFGADINGEVKVYASELIAFANFDSCANMIYKANGLDRPVFHCSDIGSVLSVNVKLKTRINDSLTCVAQVTPIDVLEPQFVTPCPGNIQKTTLGSTATATWTPPTATDNCTATTITGSHASGSSFPIGSTQVSYTAKDAYNNTNNCAFVVTVLGLTSCTTNLAPANNATGIDFNSVTFSWNAATNATNYDLYLGTTNPPTTIAKSNVFATTTTVTGLAGSVKYYWYVVPKNGNGNATGCQSSVTNFTTMPACLPLTNAGSISANQTICSGGDPAAFANATAPSGGSGTIEYIWQQTTLDPATNPTSWANIGGATAATFDPAALTQSTWYRRGARRANCTDYLFTSSVKVTVISTPTPQFILAQPVCSVLSGSLTLTNLPAGFYSKLDNGAQNLNQTTYANLTPGQHTIIIGSNGCDKSATFTINALPAAPVALCKNISVQVTPANGNLATVAAAAINNGSTGACQPLAFKINFQNSLSFSCANLGANTATLLVTDAAGRTSNCTATITVQDLTPPTLVCKNFSADLDANGQVSIAPANVFQSGTDNCGGTVNLVSVAPNSFGCNNLGANTVTLTANDGKGNAATCTATVTVGQNAGTLISYAILVQDEVHMHTNTVNGNIGVWKEAKEVKIHDASTVTGFVRSPVIDLEAGSTISGTQTLAQAPEPALATFKYNTQPDPPSDVLVPDNYVGVYLLTGTNFKKIEVGKNSTAKFMATGVIYVKEFKTKDADAGKQTVVQFSGNTELVVRRKIELGKRTAVNWGAAHRVKFYVEEDNSLIRESSKVNASVDIRFKDLNVDDATESSHTLLNGQFIAKKIDSKKWVDWSWSPYECTSPPPAAPLIVPDDQLVFLASPAHEKVSLQWVSNTEAKNERFVVERSANGVDFEPLLETPAIGIEAVETYRDNDGSPQEGANFYRVRAVFQDGTSLVSEVRQVNFWLDKDDLNVFPNPATSEVFIFKENYVGKPAAVRICNSLGRPVQTYVFDAMPAEPLRLDVGALPAGLYWLTVQADGLRERSKQIFVE